MWPCVLDGEPCGAENGESCAACGAEDGGSGGSVQGGSCGGVPRAARSSGGAAGSFVRGVRRGVWRGVRLRWRTVRAACGWWRLGVRLEVAAARREIGLGAASWGPTGTNGNCGRGGFWRGFWAVGHSIQFP